LQNFHVISDKISHAIIITAVSLSICLLLAGCGIVSTYNRESAAEQEKQINAYELEESHDSISVYDVDGRELTTSESVINMMEEEDEEISGADLVNSSDALLSDESFEYAYSMLSGDEQTVYKEIYVAMSGLKEKVVLSTLDSEVIDHCFKAVLVDHPEIFYVTGYSINKFSLGDTIKKITFTGTYSMDAGQVEQKKPAIENYVSECLEGISQDAPDYYKVKYVYEYLIRDNTYDIESENNQNILSVCENHATVCQGYAKMTQLLLNRLGVFCTIVNGKSVNTGSIGSDGTIYESDGSWEAHVWNIVRVDGKYYNVDATWGDGSFVYQNDSGKVVEGPDINYDYLLVSTSEMISTHKPAPVVEMPLCDSMDDNYYVREGMYLTEITNLTLKGMFDNAYSRGDMYISIKCSDDAVYSELTDYLFNREKVFNYLSGSTVRYIEYESRRVVVVYL